MKTTFVISDGGGDGPLTLTLSAGVPGARGSFSTRFSQYTCSTICAAVRFPFTPLMPLAQNLQPTGQPTWELTQAVRRSASGIMTVSAVAPFGQPSRSLI